MTRIIIFGLCMLTLRLLCAQEWGRPPRSDVPQAREYPLVTLSYYTGPEGARRQEYVELELDGWTPQKDVLISSRWIQISGIPVPGARAPNSARSNPFRSRYARFPSRREWYVEYVDAVTEGESHLFINADGLRRVHRQIRLKDEIFGFAHIPNHGWYELRRAAKAFRDHLPPSDTQNPPGQTRPSPSDTQGAPETRSR